MVIRPPTDPTTMPVAGSFVLQGDLFQKMIMIDDMMFKFSSLASIKYTYGEINLMYKLSMNRE